MRCADDCGMSTYNRYENIQGCFIWTYVIRPYDCGYALWMMIVEMRCG